MAEAQSKASLPFGLSPITLVFIGLGVVGAIIYLFFPPGPEPGSSTSVASRPSTPVRPVQVPVAAAAGPGGETGAAVAKAQDELDTFLVSFGRPNPFAPVGTAKAASPPSSNKDAVRAQLRELQSGQPGDRTGSVPAPPPKPAFALTGIVRMLDKALAVIQYGAKSYIVAPDSPLGETGYVLKEIGGEGVTLVSDKGEVQSLPLRRKKL